LAGERGQQPTGSGRIRSIVEWHAPFGPAEDLDRGQTDDRTLRNAELANYLSGITRDQLLKVPETAQLLGQVEGMPPSGNDY
jgi:hypothetical protein